MHYSVFTYGSLLFPEIMTAVTARSFPSHPAFLARYARYRVRNASYPGIIPSPDASVTGCLYTGIDLSTLKKLDHFEGDLYERQTVEVHCDNQLRSAQTYVVAPGQEHHLTKTPWDPDYFKENDYACFLDQCRAPRQRMNARQAGE